MCLRPPCYDYALNCHLVYLAIPGTRPLCMKKQNLFVLITYMQSQKMKFKSVIINMKQVSYFMRKVSHGKRISIHILGVKQVSMTRKCHKSQTTEQHGEETQTKPPDAKQWSNTHTHDIFLNRIAYLH